MSTLETKVHVRLPRRAVFAASVLALLAAPACMQPSDKSSSGSGSGGAGSSTSTEASTSGTSSGGASSTSGTSTSTSANTNGTSTSTSGPGSTSSTGSGGSCAAPIVSTCAPAKTYLAPEVDVPWDGNYETLIAADIDGDGKDDLVTASADSQVQVYLSNGDGTFKTPITIEEAAGTNPTLVAGDFNQDCKTDLALGSFNGDSVDDYVDVLSGKGNGMFALPSGTEISTTNLFHLIAADFNGDGKLDLMFDGQDGGPFVMLSSGNGHFAGPGTAVAINGAYTAADLDGDGAAEIIFGGSDPNNSDGSAMCISKNNGNAQFATPVCVPMTSNTSPSFAITADLNGDGKLDIVIGGGYADATYSTFVNVFINNGDGTFADHVDYPFIPDSSAMALVDVNNDGKPDLVFRSTSFSPTLYVATNNGDGTFGAMPDSYTLGSVSSQAIEPMAAGDFKGNGLKGFAGFNYTTQTISVVMGDCKP